jgi:hypothetical protein
VHEAPPPVTSRRTPASHVAAGLIYAGAVTTIAWSAFLLYGALHLLGLV